MALGDGLKDEDFVWQVGSEVHVRKCENPACRVRTFEAMYGTMMIKCPSCQWVGTP